MAYSIKRWTIFFFGAILDIIEKTVRRCPGWRIYQEKRKDLRMKSM